MEKDTQKPRDSEKTTDMLTAYSKSLEIWQKSFSEMQEAATKAFKLYLKGFEQAMSQSNFDDMKKYNELWQNISKQFEQYGPYYWSVKAWDDIWKESGFVSFGAFTDYWQSVWKNFAKNAETMSQEAFKQLGKQKP